MEIFFYFLILLFCPQLPTQNLRGCPLRARRQNSLKPSEVILESRKHSALTWSIEINMTWHRERKQVVEYSYINIFLYYIICIKFCYKTRGLNGPWEIKIYIYDESYPKWILINTIGFVVQTSFPFNTVIIFPLCGKIQYKA